MQESIRLGAAIGAVFGGLIGAGAGALTMTLGGILAGLIIGLFLGLVTGVLTAALTVRTAGTTGGIGVGYFTGMVFGGVFGMFLGVLIPPSLRMSASTEGIPVLDALVMGRFETAMLASFLFSILATMVGAWVGGKNLVPRNLTVKKQERIDQFDLIEIVVVPEQYNGIIEIGDIGVAVEIYDHEDFEVECLNPDGSYKWLATLNERYIRLKSKIPDNM
jgi:hypothetical protein